VCASHRFAVVNIARQHLHSSGYALQAPNVQPVVVPVPDFDFNQPPAELMNPPVEAVVVILSDLTLDSAQGIRVLAGKVRSHSHESLRSAA